MLTNHLQQPQRLLQDLRLQIRRPDGNGLLSHQQNRFHPEAQLHLWTTLLPAGRVKKTKITSAFPCQVTFHVFMFSVSHHCDTVYVLLA